jgi:NADH:ubiquinone oxidoreductase subunit 6 (subunit J)
MNAATANAINSIALIGLGLWGYFGAAEKASPTAMIPVAFGLVLIAMTPGIIKHNKMIAHVAVLLTLLILIALIMPLKGAIGRGDTMAIIRVGAMMATSAFAMLMFIKSFIDARKATEAIESAE